MKKKVLYLSAGILLAACAVAFGKKVSYPDSDIRENIEALSDSDPTHYGHCGEVRNACMTQCPICFSQIIAVGEEHKGPAHSITCPFCGAEVPD